MLGIAAWEALGSPPTKAQPGASHRDHGFPRALGARSDRLCAGFNGSKTPRSSERGLFSTHFQSGSAGIGIRIDVSSHPSVDSNGG